MACAGYLSSPGFVDCLQGYDPVRGPWRSVGISQSGAYAIDAKAQRAKVFLNIGRTSDPALLYGVYSLVLLRRLLPQHEGVLLHAAGLANGEGGYVFVGPSGSGKSTVARAARDMGWLVLADDGLIIRREPAGGFRAYRTPWNMAAAPWNGTFGQRPDSVSVRAVHFLRHGKRDRRLPVSPVAGALGMANNVLPTMQASPGQDAAFLFGLLTELAGSVPCFDLCFTPSCRFLEEVSFSSRKGED
jgi:hypothetical protein